MRDIRPLESARWKVDHAKWHMDRLDGLVGDYLASEPCTAILSSNLQLGDRHFVLQVKEVPRDISLALGDALGCLRCLLYTSDAADE